MLRESSLHKPTAKRVWPRTGGPSGSTMTAATGWIQVQHRDRMRGCPRSHSKLQRNAPEDQTGLAHSTVAENHHLGLDVLSLPTHHVRHLPCDFHGALVSAARESAMLDAHARSHICVEHSAFPFSHMHAQPSPFCHGPSLGVFFIQKKMIKSPILVPFTNF